MGRKLAATVYRAIDKKLALGASGLLDNVRKGFDMVVEEENRTARNVREALAIVTSAGQAVHEPKKWMTAYETIHSFQLLHLRMKCLYLGGFTLLYLLAVQTLTQIVPAIVQPLFIVGFLVGVIAVDRAAEALFAQNTGLPQTLVTKLLIAVDACRTIYKEERRSG